jgi:hypothetical protein
VYLLGDSQFFTQETDCMVMGQQTIRTNILLFFLGQKKNGKQNELKSQGCKVFMFNLFVS